MAKDTTKRLRTRPAARRAERPSDTASRTGGVQSVKRALQILEVLGEDAEGYRLGDLAVRTGLSPSTAHRLLTTLESRRFAQFDRAEGTWHVGRQLFTVGSAFVRRRNFVAAAMPVLRSLRDATHETANLGVADEGELVVLAQVESREIVRAIAVVGGRAPMTSDALGKALLATWPEAEVATLVQRRGLARTTGTTLTRAGALRADLDRARRDGYALDRGEFIAELRCAAAPIFDPHGEAIAAISVSGLASRLPDDRLAALGATVREAAERLTETLGGAPRPVPA